MPADFLARAFRAGQEGCTHPGRVPHWSSAPGVLPKPSENGAQHSVVIANQADKPWLLYPAGLSRFSVPLHLRPQAPHRPPVVAHTGMVPLNQRPTGLEAR